MTRTFAVALAVLLAAPSAAPAQPILTLEPAKELRSLLGELRSKDAATRTAAATALGTRDDAAPYLRYDRGIAFDPDHKRALAAALAPIEARAHARNITRAATWAKERRLDLLTELLATCPPADAPRVVAHVVAVQAVMHAEYKKFYPGVRTSFLPPDYDRLHGGKDSQLVQGDRVSIAPGMQRVGLVRCDSCAYTAMPYENWLVAARDECRGRDRPHDFAVWRSSVVLVNRPTRIWRCERSLVVADGDIELVGDGWLEWTVVIANGTIRAEGKELGTSFRDAVLGAAADIDLRKRAMPASYFRAGGSARFRYEPDPTVMLKEKAADPTFGVRFVDPREHGLAVEAADDGVKVAKLDAASAFARYGVREGDVITRVDHEDADTIPAFRRGLRRGVLAESAILFLRRDGEKLTRVVFLTEPTKP